MPEELMRLMIIGPADADRRGPRHELDEPAAVRDAREEDEELSLAEATKILRDFATESGELLTSVAAMPYVEELQVVRNRLLQPEGDDPNPAELVEDTFRIPISQISDTQEWAPTKTRINDSLIAHKLVPQGGARPIAELADLLRTMEMVEGVATQSVVDANSAKEILTAPLQLPEVFSRNGPVQSPGSVFQANEQFRQQRQKTLAQATELARQLSNLKDRIDQIDLATIEIAELDCCDVNLVFPPGKTRRGESCWSDEWGYRRRIGLGSKHW